MSRSGAQRFGQSLTLLPDGPALQFGGEHEDYYDPDFCIYNDVFVHEGDGSITIYGYPESAFPPRVFTPPPWSAIASMCDRFPGVSGDPSLR